MKQGLLKNLYFKLLGSACLLLVCLHFFNNNYKSTNIAFLISNVLEDSYQHTFQNKKFYTVISVNVDSLSNFYMFNVPMICEAWRLVNYEPIIIIVSSSNRGNISKSSLKTIEYLKKLNVRILKVKSPVQNEVIITMLVRLFIGLFNIINEDDFVITTDSDLYPIRKEYYHVKNTNSITLWNAFW